ncbi:MAG: response regulator [Lachnospiraceae bacterium]|nr:response regulator [Lachnospiraceae bacterium]
MNSAYHFSEKEANELRGFPALLAIFENVDGTEELILASDALLSVLHISKEQEKEAFRDGLKLTFHWRGANGKELVLAGKSVGRKRMGHVLFYVTYVDETALYHEIRKGRECEELRNNMLEKVLNTTQACLFWKDLDRKFIGVNQAFLDTYGFESAEDIIGKTDEDMGWHPYPEEFYDAEAKVLRGETMKLGHTKNMIRGKEKDIVASKAPFYDEKGEVAGLVGSFLDVTVLYDEKRRNAALNRELQNALEDSRHANNLLTQFLSRASHEIRTPMNAIIGLSEIALEQNDPDVSVDYFRKIAASGHYLLNIINDILDINKIEAGNMVLVEKPANLGELLEGVEVIMDPQISAKNIKYEYDMEGIPDAWLICDRQRIQQILINILSNAVKFTECNGRIRFTGKLADEADGCVLTFTIADEGCGMSKEFLARIFKPFSQENRDPAKYGAGTGLGLTISKRFVQMMKGDICVESEEGKGSTFTVTIRAKRCKPEKLKVKELAEEAQEVSSLKGKRILVAEDNSINAEVVQMVLMMNGMECDIARNGRDAVEIFASAQQHTYDAILMDIQMPMMGGFEATQRIRHLGRPDAKTIPIIALSADAFASTQRHAEENGMDGFISKPIDRKLLIKCLIELVQEGREI